MNAEDEDIGWADINKPVYFGLCGLFFFGFETLTYPVDFLKTRQQHAQHPLTHTSIVKSVVRSEGVKGLFRGYATSVSGSLPGQLLYFASYEVVKTMYEEVFPFAKSSVSHQFVANLCGGFVADCATLLLQTPFDVVSQRAVVSPSHNPNDVLSLSHVKLSKQKGIEDCIVDLVRVC
eukprot:m.47785 g.47785  ORF g.47785 m.47785 type:complete len:177 (-) comp10790_c0_seq3:475-1005(-)